MLVLSGSLDKAIYSTFLFHLAPEFPQCPQCFPITELNDYLNRGRGLHLPGDSVSIENVWLLIIWGYSELVPVALQFEKLEGTELIEENVGKQLREKK